MTAAAKEVAEENGKPDPTTDPTSDLNPVNVQHALNISADQMSDIIDFSVRMPSAALAQQVAEAIYTAFVKQNESSARELAQRAITSLKAQSTSIANQLKAIDEKSSEMRQKTNFPDVVAQSNSEIAGLEQITQARDTAKIDVRGKANSQKSSAAKVAIA